MSEVGTATQNSLETSSRSRKRNGRLGKANGSRKNQLPATQQVPTQPSNPTGMPNAVPSHHPTYPQNPAMGNHGSGFPRGIDYGMVTGTPAGHISGMQMGQPGMGAANATSTPRPFSSAYDAYYNTMFYGGPQMVRRLTVVAFCTISPGIN